MADTNSASSIFCGTCEKGFARRKTYDDNFLASRKENAERLQREYQQKADQSLMILKSYPVLALVNTFSLSQNGLEYHNRSLEITMKMRLEVWWKQYLKKNQLNLGHLH